VALNGLVVVFVVAADRYRVRLLSVDGRAQETADDDESPGEEDRSALGSVYDAAPAGTDSYGQDEFYEDPP
jgi:hypothetical protein